MLVVSTYRITGLHYTYECATFSGANVGYLYVEYYWVTLNYGWSTLRAAYVGYLYQENHCVTLHL